MQRSSWAIACTKAELIKRIRRDGVNHKDANFHQTPLHLFAECGNDEFVQLLLTKYKADVNVVDKNGWTPLHAAANAGHVHVCEILLKLGAFPRALTDEGASVLHYFCRAKVSDAQELLFLNVFKLMLDKGANVNERNTNGETPLHQAALRNRTKMVLYLLNEPGIDVNATTRTGETPLHFAVRANNALMVSILLKHGTDPFIHSDEGTPLQVADSLGVAKVRDTLVAHLRTMRAAQIVGDHELACAQCQGAQTYPLNFHIMSPEAWVGPERPDMVLSWDLCRIGQRRFIKADEVLRSTSIACHEPEDGRWELSRKRLQFPLNLTWLVWVEVAVGDFDAYVASWHDPERIHKPAIAGTLANHVRVYNDTLGLPVKVWLQPPGLRPMACVTDTSHRLWHEQQRGMSTRSAASRCAVLLRSMQSS